MKNLYSRGFFKRRGSVVSRFSKKDKGQFASLGGLKADNYAPAYEPIILAGFVSGPSVKLHIKSPLARGGIIIRGKKLKGSIN